MKKEEVYALATDANPIVIDNGNRIEFADGTICIRQSGTDLYRKARLYIFNPEY